jgi:very-short-patch-repair endonuclease
LKSISWKCTTCENIWKSTPTHILNDNSGCSLCSGNKKLNKEIVNTRLAGRYVLIEEYKNINTKSLFKCFECSHEWKTQPDHLLNSKSGCPICSLKEMKISNEEFDKRLELCGSMLDRCENLNGIDKKINFKCKKCNHISLYIPESVQYGQTCKKCSKTRENLVGYYLTLENIFYTTQYVLKDNDKTYRVDFFIPAINMVIEYNGPQHYMPIKFKKNQSKEEIVQQYFKQLQRDFRVKELLEKDNIKLLELPYSLTNIEIKEIIKELQYVRRI